MTAAQDPAFPQTGTLVTTACKGRIRFERNTPYAIYHGRWVYFCLPVCLQAFRQDPKTSCLADKLLRLEDE